LEGGNAPARKRGSSFRGPKHWQGCVSAIGKEQTSLKNVSEIHGGVLIRWASITRRQGDRPQDRLVRAFVKKTQKTPRAEIELAARKGNQMTIQFEKLKARLLANPKVKAEYDALAPEFEIAAELLRARLRADLSQAELAARMGTSQSTIARLENGHTLPSTKTLLRYAEATGSKFHVRLSAA
jgi:DNA-binding XRE family transcriptional regulator